MKNEYKCFKLLKACTGKSIENISSSKLFYQARHKTNSVCKTELAVIKDNTFYENKKHVHSVNC
jgi:hypothetical protein